MHLKNLQIRKYHTDHRGIKEGQFRFPKVVCLVGKNGAGKTRLLNIIENEIRYNSPLLVMNRSLNLAPYNISTGANVISEKISIIESIAKLKYEKIVKEQNKNFEDNLKYQQLLRNFGSQPTINRQSHDLSNVYLNLEKNLGSLILRNLKRIDYRFFKQLEQKIDPSISFQKIDISDVANNPSKVLIKQNPISILLSGDANPTQDFEEIDSISKHGFQYLQDLVKHLALLKLRNFSNEEILHNTEAYKKFFTLRSLINQFLNKDLDFEIDTNSLEINYQNDSLGGLKGYWTLDKRRFNFNDLSDGEKVLFGFSFLLFIHEENSKLPVKNSIIIIDEPETHLHPELQVRIISGLKKLLGENGQLIIATHSINIISSLEPNEIFFVEKNELSPPSSKNINKIVEALIGFGEEFNKFKDFVFQEYEFAYRSFISQCLSDPEVVTSAKENDPQVDLFKKLIKENSLIKVLDFGAGSGRVGKELEKKIDSGEIEYHAFNTNNLYDSELKNLNAKDIYHELNEIPSQFFDCILLCNVLHEININQIPIELNKLLLSLNESGFLIVIEDRILPKGEKPNSNGYIVFEENDLALLLSTKKVSSFKSDNPLYKDRIMCAVISKKEAKQVSNYTLSEALKNILSKSLNEIKSIKRLDKKYNKKNQIELGRILAFYSHQYINSVMAEQEL